MGDPREALHQAFTRRSTFLRFVAATGVAPLLADCGPNLPSTITIDLPGESWQGYPPVNADHPYAVAAPKEAKKDSDGNSTLFTFPDDKYLPSRISISATPQDKKIPFQNVVQDEFPGKTLDSFDVNGQKGVRLITELLGQKGFDFQEKVQQEIVIFPQYGTIWKVTLNAIPQNWQEKQNLFHTLLKTFRTFDPLKPVPVVTFNNKSGLQTTQKQTDQGVNGQPAQRLPDVVSESGWPIYTGKDKDSNFPFRAQFPPDFKYDSETNSFLSKHGTDGGISMSAQGTSFLGALDQKYNKLMQDIGARQTGGEIITVDKTIPVDTKLAGFPAKRVSYTRSRRDAQGKVVDDSRWDYVFVFAKAALWTISQQEIAENATQFHPIFERVIKTWQPL